MQQWKVLIVDDVEVILDRLSLLLMDAGSVESVTKASDYAGAVDALQKQSFDVALLDIHLQDGKNGLELLEYIRENFPQMKVIMLTNQAGRHYRQLCKDLGAMHFVDKSREFETLPELIANI